VIAAAEEIARLRAEGKSITQLLAQMTLVDRPYSEETVEILRFLDDANRAGARLAAFINAYLDELEKYGPQGEDMFGAKPAPDKGALARQKIKGVLDDEQRLSGSENGGAVAQPAKREGEGTGARAAELPASGAPGEPAGSKPAGEKGGAGGGAARERAEVKPKKKRAAPAAVCRGRGILNPK
jgi:hypothetical protein